MEKKNYYVYILTNRSGTLYIESTGNLKQRVQQHKKKKCDGFTKKYNIDQFVYYEQAENIICALSREKQLKKWRREKKIQLIEKLNPFWLDLVDSL